MRGALRPAFPEHQKIGDTQVIIKAGKEHRFVVIFRGKDSKDR
jgi:2,3-bisphosphoglycerate-independent phosphoglycerate mutase